MTILIDTREKKYAHILQYFDKHGIAYKRQKLDEGDYAIEGDESLTIDRKQNLDEMYNCLICESGRFWREVRRCYDKKKKLIILIEHGGEIANLSDVSAWGSKFGRASGNVLSKRLFRLEMAYGVKTIFCDKKHTAEKIVEILTEKKC